MRRFFDIDSPLMRNLVRIFDCMCLSVLWMLFSIPIVTIGASSAAMYRTVSHYIRKDEGHLGSTFLGAFKSDFRRNTLAWLVLMALMFLLLVDALVFRSMVLDGKFLGNLYYLILVLICVAITWCAYLAAYCASFNGSVKEVLRFSALLLVLHPVRALGVFLPILGAAALILIFPALLIVAPAAACWIGSTSLEKVFLQHLRPEDLEKVTQTDQPL